MQLITHWIDQPIVQVSSVVFCEITKLFGTRAFTFMRH